jgi:hypothetical protein
VDKCPKGHPIRPTDQYCRVCGAEVLRCPNGHTVTELQVFCPVCGVSTAEGPAAALLPAIGEPVASSSAETLASRQTMVPRPLHTGKFPRRREWLLLSALLILVLTGAVIWLVLPGHHASQLSSGTQKSLTNRSQYANCVYEAEDAIFLIGTGEAATERQLYGATGRVHDIAKRQSSVFPDGGFVANGEGGYLPDATPALSARVEKDCIAYYKPDSRDDHLLPPKPGATPAAVPSSPASATPTSDGNGVDHVGDSPSAAPAATALVLGPPGVTTIYGLAGPSAKRDATGNLSVYPAVTTPVQVGSNLKVVCTVYGQLEDLLGQGSNSLWYYTADGWFNSSALNTGSTGPVAMACQGNISAPVAGGSPPSQSTGPFPIYSGGMRVAVRSAPSSTANGGTPLNDGDLVTLVCTAKGDAVPAPQDLSGQPIGQSDSWDKISFEADKWVPDALVNSSSENAVAPPC